MVSQNWNNGGTDRGAATWATGTVATGAAVSTTNSIYGTTNSDQVGSAGVTALTGNGNFVVASPNWDNGGTADVGAATFADGSASVSAAVSTTNSLIGSTASDQVGSNGVFALSNGNYVVRSSLWNNGAATTAGAITFGSGTTGIIGTVSSSNSTIGSTIGDTVGDTAPIELDIEYVFIAPNWNHDSVTDAGAVLFLDKTRGDFCNGSFGEINSSNSFLGLSASSTLSNLTAGDNFALVRFNNYEGQTRVFAVTGASTLLNSITGKALNSFAAALAEGFDSFTPMTLQGLVGPYQISIFLPSLVEEGNNRSKITQR